MSPLVISEAERARAEDRGNHGALDVPLPLKIKAQENVLARAPQNQQQLLQEIRMRGPMSHSEQELWDRFVRDQSVECRYLEQSEHWSTADLIGLLSDAQKRALNDAGRHLKLQAPGKQQLLRAALPTLLDAKHDELMEIKNRERLALTHWTEWERLLG